ncbi:hypothetical protein [Ralstonia mojiangensis]|uniref:hypothetical protein n=1 Tax=Ralstonia mojiangensis TaxID=2953895 RepID=UPI0020905915|nr:hypothetical protein [Ralstonia mojiangensis]MCO5412139.1 hypothetical protein [Ralstonia mojiangensis]
MALYFLDYDLRKQRNYQPLYDELARFNAVRMLESSWCFKRFNTNAANLRDHFKNFIDADDGLLVGEVNDWATFNAQRSPNALAAT